MEALIIIIIAVLFALAGRRTYLNMKASKEGKGCAGCQIANTCQKIQHAENTVKQMKADCDAH